VHEKSERKLKRDRGRLKTAMIATPLGAERGSEVTGRSQVGDLVITFLACNIISSQESKFGKET